MNIRSKTRAYHRGGYWYCRRYSVVGRGLTIPEAYRDLWRIIMGD